MVQMPLLTLFFCWIGLALGWGVRRFHSDTSMLSIPTEFWLIASTLLSTRGGRFADVRCCFLFRPTFRFSRPMKVFVSFFRSSLGFYLLVSFRFFFRFRFFFIYKKHSRTFLAITPRTTDQKCFCIKYFFKIKKAFVIHQILLGWKTF